MLDRLQEHIEAIYGIRCEHRASDFLVDPDAAQALGGSRGTREELLVLEDDDGLELALYIEPALLGRVSAVDPNRALELDLAGFCEVAEGVSHFVYLARSATLDRTVSLLELEAQGEVDKFAICALLRWGTARWTPALLGHLFDRASIKESLSGAERWRYQESSRIARAYCSTRLLPLFAKGDLERVLTELRHAYRLGAEANLHYFARG
jgi:hypothetical protein